MKIVDSGKDKKPNVYNDLSFIILNFESELHFSKKYKLFSTLHDMKHSSLCKSPKAKIDHLTYFNSNVFYCTEFQSLHMCTFQVHFCGISN